MADVLLRPWSDGDLPPLEKLLGGPESPEQIVQRINSITVPTLVMDGGASLTFMHNAAQAVVEALPNSQHLGRADP